jgi:hypothetical protein
MEDRVEQETSSLDKINHRGHRSASRLDDSNLELEEYDEVGEYCAEDGQDPRAANRKESQACEGALPFVGLHDSVQLGPQIVFAGCKGFPRKGTSSRTNIHILRFHMKKIEYPLGK